MPSLFDLTFFSQEPKKCSQLYVNVVRSQMFCAENHENSKAVRIDQSFLFFLTFSKKEIIFVSFIIGKQYLHSTVFLCTIINDPHRTATVMGEHNILAYS